MSVRDRIQGFEAIGHGKPEEKEASSPTSRQNGMHIYIYNMLTLLRLLFVIGKKFFHPRMQSNSKTDRVVVLPQLKTKQSAISG